MNQNFNPPQIFQKNLNKKHFIKFQTNLKTFYLYFLLFKTKSMYVKKRSIQIIRLLDLYEDDLYHKKESVPFVKMK